MSDFERDLNAHVDGLTPPVPPPYDEVTARTARRRTRRRALIATLGSAVAILAIVGGASAFRPDGRAEDPPVTTPSSSRTSSGTPDVPPEWDEQGAPPVFLQLDGRQAVLEPWASCYGNACFDGAPQPPYEDVGDRNVVLFSFPEKGWEFQATFTPMEGGPCARALTVDADRLGDYTFQVPAAGPPGDYRVDLFGRGDGGDVVTSFRWRSAVAGEIPEPSGYLGLVSDEDDHYVAYPLEMGLQDLATTPRNATLTVTVTAADGATRTYGPITPEKGCWSEGQLFFRQGESGAAQPFELGPAPFDYRVEVTLDGQTYVGTAVWPRDEKRDEAPYTTLTFDPPLPAYTG